MNRGVAYLSGPMAGKEDLNAEQFRLAQAWLERQNFTAMVPHDIQVWLHSGDCPGGYRSSPDAPHAGACYLRTDIIEMLRKADVVFMLPGWEFSIGARLEMQVAATCGLPVKFVPQEALDWMASPEPKMVFDKNVPPGRAVIIDNKFYEHGPVVLGEEPAWYCGHHALAGHATQRDCDNYEQQWESS